MSVHAPDRLRTVRADQVQLRSIEFLEKPLIQNSVFTVVAGPKGVGKGTWIARVSAKMSRGDYGRPRNVLIVSSEDSASIDLGPRLLAAGADLTKVELVVDHFTLPADLERLRQLAADVGDIGLIVIDPVSNHIGATDGDKETAVRFAIGGLNGLADDLACVVLGVRHIGKNRTNGSLAAVLGSTAWVDLPRAVLMVARDDEDEMIFHVQVVAGNRSGRGNGRAYRLELRDVGLLEPVTCAVELGESTKDVDDLLLLTRNRPSKSQNARDRILDILENEGEQDSDTLDARIANETGISAKTARNQRTDLKNVGLIKNTPDKDKHGTVLRWKVHRTSAPRT